MGVWCESPTGITTLPGGNDIFGNKGYELENGGAPTLSADGNYWGEPTTTELNSGAANLTRIYDGVDDPRVGQVVITQWSPTRLTTLPLP